MFQSTDLHRAVQVDSPITREGQKTKSMRPRIDKNRFQQIVKGILFFYKTPERLIIKKILPLSVGEGKRKKKGGGGYYGNKKRDS